MNPFGATLPEWCQPVTRGQRAEEKRDAEQAALREIAVSALAAAFVVRRDKREADFNDTYEQFTDYLAGESVFREAMERAKR